MDMNQPANSRDDSDKGAQSEPWEQCNTPKTDNEQISRQDGHRKITSRVRELEEGEIDKEEPEPEEQHKSPKSVHDEQPSRQDIHSQSTRRTQGLEE